MSLKNHTADFQPYQMVVYATFGGTIFSLFESLCRQTHHITHVVAYYARLLFIDVADDSQMRYKMHTHWKVSLKSHFRKFLAFENDFRTIEYLVLCKRNLMLLISLLVFVTHIEEGMCRDEVHKNGLSVTAERRIA